MKSADYLNFSNIASITIKLKYLCILINAEGIRVKHPTTTEFPIQAYLTKQHCPEKHIAFGNLDSQEPFKIGRFQA